MTKWLALAFMLGIAVALLKRFGRSVGKGLAALPVKPSPVLSRPEQSLFFRLVQALPEHVILAQVQLSRMIVVTTKNNARAIRNTFDRKSADFVVCNKDFSVLAVIELDDSTHQRSDRIKADAVKDHVLKSAGLRLMRWHVKELPSVEQIQREVLSSTVVRAP